MSTEKKIPYEPTDQWKEGCKFGIVAGVALTVGGYYGGYWIATGVLALFG